MSNIEEGMAALQKAFQRDLENQQHAANANVVDTGVDRDNLTLEARRTEDAPAIGSTATASWNGDFSRRMAGESLIQAAETLPPTPQPAEPMQPQAQPPQGKYSF